MIKITVKIELLPYGFEENKSTLGSAVIEELEAKIYNDGTGTRTRGNYVFKFFDKLGRLRTTGEIKDFPRKELNAWSLLYLCLDKMIGNKNAKS